MPHHITTCPPSPRFSDLPTALQKLLREERGKNLGKLFWFFSKSPKPYLNRAECGGDRLYPHRTTGFTDRPTALQKLLREERRKNLGKLHWFISKWPTFIFMYMRDFIRTTTRKLEWNLTFPHRSAVMLRLPRVFNLPTVFLAAQNWWRQDEK